MTKDEVLAMTDGELRVRVAHMFGATDVHLFPSGHQMAFRSDLTRHNGEIIVGRWEDKERGEIWREILDYPNDIKAAWELVDRLKAVDQRDKYVRYLSEIILGKPYPDKHGDIWYLIHSSPRDQVRAFILAMEKEK